MQNDYYAHKTKHKHLPKDFPRRKTRLFVLLQPSGKWNIFTSFIIDFW